MEKKNFKILALIVLALIVLTVTSYSTASIIRKIHLIEFTDSLGIFGPIFLITGITTGGVTLFLTTIPFMLTGITLYGFWTTFIIYYLGNAMIAPVIDFWIARKWGRHTIKKLTGEKSLEKIDEISRSTGLGHLIVLRIFGGNLFDYVSYASGLTNIDFKLYYLVTLTLSVPAMLLVLYLLDKGITKNFLYLELVVILGYIAGFIIFRQIKKKTH